MRKKHARVPISKREKLVLVLTALFILASLTSGILAKYIKTHEASDGVVPNKFYFTSDYLKEGGAEYTIYGDSVTFNLYNNDGINYTDQNNIRYRNIQITSGTLHADKVNYNSDGIPQLTRTPTGTATGSYHTYTLTKGASNTVTVSVITTAAYKKTLSATFNFVPVEEGYYRVTDHEHYIIVDIYTGANPPGGGEQRITCRNLAADTSNPVMSTLQRPALDTQTTYTLNLAQNTHYELMFFKMKAFDMETVTSDSPLSATIVLN